MVVIVYGSSIYNCLCNQYLSTLTLSVRIPLMVLNTTLCDKVCQWLVAGRWLSLGTLLSSTNKTNWHNVTEILLKVPLNTITLTHHSGFIFQVFLRCGNKNEIVNVSEPNTCQYHMNFNSPYVCHPHAMLVFPTLSQDLREQWEILEGRLINEEITNKVC
jgi:hypothetical protein